MISWAGHGEDQILRRILSERTPGTYIDIGAAHPKFGSVTFALYQAGWSGIAIEPRRELSAVWKNLRPKDLLIEAALTIEGKAGFMTRQGFRSHFVKENENLNNTALSKTNAISTTDLTLIMKDQFSLEPTLVKIDVEGNEFSITKNLLENKVRPEIWLIEVIDQFESEHIRRDSSWSMRELLEAHNYELKLFDGVNEWYVISNSESIDRNIWAPAYPGVENFIPFHLTLNYRTRHLINRWRRKIKGKIARIFKQSKQRHE